MIIVHYEPCGCGINAAAKDGVAIVYCPTHAAAPEMLEALKAVLDVLKWNEVDEGIGPTGIGNRIRAVIEKVEDK